MPTPNAGYDVNDQEIPFADIEDEDQRTNCVPETKCPGSKAIITSPVVRSAAADLFNNANRDHLEWGAYIYKNADGTIRVGPYIQGQLTTVSQLAGTPPSDAIGWIHAHWGAAGQNGPSGCYGGGPTNYLYCGDYKHARDLGIYAVVSTYKYLYMVTPTGSLVKANR